MNPPYFKAKASISLRFILILTFLVRVINPANAQLDNYSGIVNSLFENIKTDVEVEHFSGYFENAHKIDLAFGYDGSTIRGVYRFLTEELLFYVDGTVKNDSILLLVTDEFEENCGYIKLQRNQEVLKGLWINLNQNKKYSLDFTKGLTKNQPDNKQWLRKYSTAYADHYESIMVEKMENRKAFAKYYSKSANATIESQSDCISNDCENVSFSFDSEDFPFDIQASISAVNDLSLNYQLSTGATTKKMALELELFYLPIQKLSYSYRIDAFLPNTKSETLNQFLFGKCKTITDAFEQKVQEIENEEGMNPNIHLRYELLGWSEIDYISKHLISGTIIFINNVTNNAESFRFNFNFDEDTLFEINSVLKEEMFTNTEVQELITSGISEFLEANSGLDHEWVSTLEIKPTNFNESGILFSSTYNMKYETIKILVPYSLLSSPADISPIQKLMTTGTK